VPHKIGVIGLGRMGLPICARLARRGFSVVAHDVRAALREPAAAAGAVWASGAAAAAVEADAVVTVLPGPAEVSGLIGELTGALAPGSVWIDMSTATPAVARAIASRGVRSLDAPIGGNPQAARDGRLHVFVGGDPEVLASARGVLEALADSIVHLGPAGCGYTGKLLVNALWFAHAVAAAEALALGARAGIDPETLRSTLAQSAAASRFLSDDAPALLAGETHASFALARCCEQLASVLELGAELSVALDVAAVVSEIHRDALERYGALDGELLGARYVAERAGLPIEAANSS
jgi:3-hydroxyisobutyrate dehydrogenase